MEFIARQTGVSKATVSRVINNKGQGVGAKTRERVKCAIEEYGYKPNLLARGIATAHTKIIGLVVSDICNPFFPALIKAIEAVLSDRGYTVLLCDTGENADKEERCISTLVANRVDGVVLAATLQNPQMVEQRIEQYQIPLVLVDREAKEIKQGVGFCVDNEYGMYVATEHLIRHGDRKIAFIKGPHTVSATEQRLQGYVMALQTYNVDLRKNLVLNGDFTFQSGYRAVQMLHTEGVVFDAILASN
ncbi:MAG: LacI family DNA-binding transcriptional regulator, partial [Ruthenibacterium sp.]